MKITCPMIVTLLEAWLARVPPDTILFQLKPSEFRALHDKVARFFCLATADGVGVTPASHRGGGAMAFFEECQCLDLVRWAGRWSTQSRTMEIYVQEVAAASALPSLTESQRHLAREFAQAAVTCALHAIQVFRSP